MRIGFDAKRAFYNARGLGNYSRSTILGISTFYPDNQYYLYTPSIKKAILFNYSGNIRIRKPETIISRFFSSGWRSLTMGKNISADQLHLFHGLSNELPVNMPGKVKSVVSIHDLIFMRYPGFYDPVSRLIYKLKVSRSCSIANMIIAVSRQTKNDLVDFLNVDEKKIQVVYQSCSPIFYKGTNTMVIEQLQENYHLPSQFILFVGAIEERKNLLSVVKALHTGNIDIPLVVIGSPTSYLNTVNRYIRRNNLSKKVFFYHTIPFVYLPFFYQTSSAFIYPSVFEGFGIPILEALFSGTPVITSQDGCFQEAGGPSSVYINPLNIEEMIHALKKVLSDSSLREKMIRDGYKHAHLFTDEKVTADLMNVYRELN